MMERIKPVGTCVNIWAGDLRGFPVGGPLRAQLSAIKTLADLRAALEPWRESPALATDADGVRGRQGSPAKVILPEGWLDDPEDEPFPKAQTSCTPAANQAAHPSGLKIHFGHGYEENSSDLANHWSNMRTTSTMVGCGRPIVVVTVAFPVFHPPLRLRREFRHLIR